MQHKCIKIRDKKFAYSVKEFRWIESKEWEKEKDNIWKDRERIERKGYLGIEVVKLCTFRNDRWLTEEALNDGLIKCWIQDGNIEKI